MFRADRGGFADRPAAVSPGAPDIRLGSVSVAAVDPSKIGQIKNGSEPNTARQAVSAAAVLKSKAHRRAADPVIGITQRQHAGYGPGERNSQTAAYFRIVKARPGRERPTIPDLVAGLEARGFLGRGCILSGRYYGGGHGAVGRQISATRRLDIENPLPP